MWQFDFWYGHPGLFFCHQTDAITNGGISFALFRRTWFARHFLSQATLLDFNAILIVAAVENWLWELHDVEYHGVHLINLSKSSRFVSVNHMSERQKTGAERRTPTTERENHILFGHCVSKQIKKLCEHTIRPSLAATKLISVVSNVWSNDTCPIWYSHSHNIMTNLSR